jgi:hypothetical protein
MAGLMAAGYWPRRYWTKNYWAWDNPYWPKFHVAGVPGADLIILDNGHLGKKLQGILYKYI